MSTPIKGSFLPDLESLLGVPQPQRTEPLKVFPSSTRRAERGPQTLGPQDQLDSLRALPRLSHSEPRPAWTRPSSSPAKVSPGPGHPGETDSPCCQGWSCGGPHSQDPGEQGGMPISHHGDNPGGLASHPGSERRHTERLGSPSPSAVGRQVPRPLTGTSWAGSGPEPGDVGDIWAPGRRCEALTTPFGYRTSRVAPSPPTSTEREPGC